MRFNWGAAPWAEWCACNPYQWCFFEKMPVKDGLYWGHSKRGKCELANSAFPLSAVLYRHPGALNGEGYVVDGIRLGATTQEGLVVGIGSGRVYVMVESGECVAFPASALYPTGTGARNLHGIGITDGGGYCSGVVLVKHGDSKPYGYSVTADQRKQVRKGQWVLVKNARGYATGVVCGFGGPRATCPVLQILGD